MENLILLFFLFAMQDPALEGRMNAFLDFYRKNRDLLLSFTKKEAPMSEDAPSKSQKESRPEQGVGVLEEYLKRVTQG